MKTISVRELHMKTGEWVRRASEERVVVTDRGRPVATLSRVRPEEEGRLFSERELLAEFRELARVSGDSTRFISRDRDRS